VVAPARGRRDVVVSARRRTRACAAAALVGALLAGCTDDAPGPGPTPPGEVTWDGEGALAPFEGSALGAKWDQGRTQQFQPYLEELDGGPTFSEVVWCDVEPTSGDRDWSTTDAFVSRTVDLGMTPMLKIRVGQCWTTGQEPQHQRGRKTESGVPRDLDAYRGFVRELVTRYAAQDVHRYAVENEVDAATFWSGTPQEYRDLVEVAVEEVRSADPEALVLDSGLSSVSYGYGIARRLLDDGREDDAVAAWNAYYERRFGTRGKSIVEASSASDLEDMLAREQGVRALAHLETASQLAEDGVVDVRQVHFYETWRAVPALFDLLRATTPEGVPLELWEVGSFVRGREVTVEEAADDTVRTSAALLSQGAALVVWLPLAFDPAGRNPDEPRTGLLEPQGEVRPAGERYLELARAARDATPVAIAGDDVVGLALEGEAGSTAFVWTVDDAPVEVSAGSTTVQLDAAPQRIELDGDVASFVQGLP
jgi:hypothetical protein